MRRCLLLAALLHVWLVLVFGNVAGTAAPGQGVWGSLSVRLLGRGEGTPGAPPGDPAPEWRDNGAAGSGAQPRHGGQVRPAAPATADPGAARLGRWNPHEVAPQAADGDEAPPTPPRPATLELPEGFRPIEREPLTMTPRSAPLPLSATPLPGPVGRLEGPADPAFARLPSTSSLREPPRVSTSLDSLPAELPPAVNRLDAAPALAPARTLPRAADLRVAPAQPLPAATPLPATVQRLEAPTAEGSRIAPLSRPSELRWPARAADLPAQPLPSSQDLPAPVRRLELPEGAAGVTPLPAAPRPLAPSEAVGGAALPELSRALPGQASAPAGPAGGLPPGDPAAAPRALAGSPDAGSRLGADQALPPSAAASAPRAPLNLSLPRSGAIAARRGPGLVDLLPQPPERKSKLERSIEEAANPDCRKAYANTGLLAALPLALDAARGKGCKW